MPAAKLPKSDIMKVVLRPGVTLHVQRQQTADALEYTLMPGGVIGVNDATALLLMSQHPGLEKVKP